MILELKGPGSVDTELAIALAATGCSEAAICSEAVEAETAAAVEGSAEAAAGAFEAVEGTEGAFEVVKGVS